MRERKRERERVKKGKNKLWSGWQPHCWTVPLSTMPSAAYSSLPLSLSLSPPLSHSPLHASPLNPTVWETCKQKRNMVLAAGWSSAPSLAHTLPVSPLLFCKPSFMQILTSGKCGFDYTSVFKCRSMKIHTKHLILMNRYKKNHEKKSTLAP